MAAFRRAQDGRDFNPYIVPPPARLGDSELRVEGLLCVQYSMRGGGLPSPIRLRLLLYLRDEETWGCRFNSPRGGPQSLTLINSTYTVVFLCFRRRGPSKGQRLAVPFSTPPRGTVQ